MMAECDSSKKPDGAPEPCTPLFHIWNVSSSTGVSKRAFPREAGLSDHLPRFAAPGQEWACVALPARDGRRGLLARVPPG